MRKYHHLTDAARRSIVARRAAGESPAQLAREYGVSRETIYKTTSRLTLQGPEALGQGVPQRVSKVVKLATGGQIHLELEADIFSLGLAETVLLRLLNEALAGYEEGMLLEGNR